MFFGIYQNNIYKIMEFSSDGYKLQVNWLGTISDSDRILPYENLTSEDFDWISSAESSQLAIDEYKKEREGT